MSFLINKLAIGSVQFGLNYGISNTEGKTSLDEVEKILDFSSRVGIDLIDTAFSYGNAENVLGNFELSNFKIVSKFMPNDESSLPFQFKESLKRMNLPKIYGYMAHRPLNLIEDNCESWKQLTELKRNGLVNKIGASLNTIEEYEKLKSYNIKLDIVQVPFNYFDKRFIKVMEELKKSDCEIHTRSTFLQGLFFSNTEDLSEHFKGVKPIISDLQAEFKGNLAGVLLKYVLSFDLIDKVVIGIENCQQLKNNIQSINHSQEINHFSRQIDQSILQPSKWIL